MSAWQALLSDTNLFPAATLSSPTAWSALAPLSLCQTLPLSARAATLALGTAEAPVIIEGVWSDRQFVAYAGLFQLNLRQSAGVRLELFGDAAMTETLFDTRDGAGADRAVFPPLLDPATIRFGASHQFRGDLPAEDFALYPTHVHVVVPLVRARAFRWSLWGEADQADGSAAGHVEIGHGWIGDSLQFARSTGSADTYDPRGVIVEMAGGGAIVEPEAGGRALSIVRDVLERPLRDAVTDMARRVGQHRPVAYLPTSGADPAEDLRWGGLYQRRGTQSNTWSYPTIAQSTIAFEEIVT